MELDNKIIADMKNTLLVACYILDWSVISGSPCREVVWSVSAVSFLVPEIKVTWNTSLADCTDRGQLEAN